MADLPPQLVQAMQTAGNIFALNPQLLLWPAILTSLILPMILNTYMIKCIFTKMNQQAIFGWTVGIVTAYLTLTFGTLIMYASVVIIGATRSWRLSFKILFIAIMEVFLFFILPALTSALNTDLYTALTTPLFLSR